MLPAEWRLMSAPEIRSRTDLHPSWVDSGQSPYAKRTAGFPPRPLRTCHSPFGQSRSGRVCEAPQWVDNRGFGFVTMPSVGVPLILVALPATDANEFWLVGRLIRSDGAGGSDDRRLLGPGPLIMRQGA